MAYQITHVRKNGPENDCTCITKVQLSTGISYTVPEIIGFMKNGHQFFVVDPKDGSHVQVKPIPEFNPTYIRTKANDTPDDNLLKLPTF